MSTKGRKLWDGKSQDIVIPKLEAAFAVDATVTEACFYADISTSSYYRFVEKNSQFRDRFAQLRNKPVLLARQTVVNALKTDPHLAFRYLEKKRKLEFGKTVQIERQTTEYEKLSDQQLHELIFGK
ncbi:hypothetical protein DYH10_00675 [Candidatus Saccharibacteria bacterium CPR2]|nr:hypothetical protein [Candidatus Saccharibacteria bacterium CPR2]